MIVYAVDAGGEYITVDEAFARHPDDKRGIYVNLTNRCTCACTFCLRTMKKMAESHTLWLKKEPTVEEVEAGLDEAFKKHGALISEVVFCGFGEPTMRLHDLVTLLGYVKNHYPSAATRVNTNGLSDLNFKRDTAPDFGGGILDTISISLNASNAERYLELTRSEFGMPSYDAMLDFAVNVKQYVPNVVLTVVDHVEDSEEIKKCQKICDERGLKLRVRVYEDK
ncbi:MAG: TatD family nuclease-associated radical SAM protein [Selenomonadaceae bacterium]